MMVGSRLEQMTTATKMSRESAAGVRLLLVKSKVMKCREKVVTVKFLDGAQHTGTAQTESESAGHYLSDTGFYCLSYAVCYS